MSNSSAFTVGFLTGSLYVIILVILIISDAGNLTKEECEQELKRTETCTPLWFPSKKEGE